MARKLEVSLDFGEGVTRSVGRLAVTETHFAFQYDDSFLAAPLLISPYKLAPLRKVFRRLLREKLWGVFEDSLPDTFGLRVLARRMAALKIDSPTPLDMLALVGKRAMGALVYTPSTDEVTPSAPMELGLLAQDTEALYRESPAKVLDALVHAAGTAGGAQPKVVVGRTPDGRLWPDGGELPPDASRWLVKFHGEQSIFSGMIEGALTTLARSAGIAVPHSEVLQAEGGRRYFAAERFDRPGHRRLHMHTFGGAALVSEFDPPTYSELLGVAHHMTKDIRASEECFRRMVFNVAVGNRDDHDKNFAFLMDSTGAWQLSPAYDITWSDPGVKGEHTMLIGSKARAITQKDCFAVAETAGVARSRAEDILGEVVTAVEKFEEHASVAELPDGVTRRIGEDIRSNVGALVDA